MTPGVDQREWRAARRIAAAVFVVGAVAGCSVLGGPRNVANDNDTLRAEKLELQREVASLEERLGLRVGEVAALRAELAERRSVPVGVDVPVLAKVALDRYSGPVDTDDDGIDDEVVAYIRTLDQRGRFLPVAAEATLLVVEIDADDPGSDSGGDGGADDEARVLARADFDHAAFDAAFRTGLTGTHHTLRVALPSPGESGPPEEVTLRLELQPASVDAEFTAQQTYRLGRPAPVAAEADAEAAGGATP